MRKWLRDLGALLRKDQPKCHTRQGQEENPSAEDREMPSSSWPGWELVLHIHLLGGYPTPTLGHLAPGREPIPLTPSNHSPTQEVLPQLQKPHEARGESNSSRCLLPPRPGCFPRPHGTGSPPLRCQLSRKRQRQVRITPLPGPSRPRWAGSRKPVNFEQHLL